MTCKCNSIIFLENKLSVAFMETVAQLEIDFWAFASFD